MRKRTDRERLQAGLWGVVMWVCVLFFAFAAGVWAGEQEQRADKPEMPKVPYRVEKPVMSTPVTPKPVVASAACAEDVAREPFTGTDPLCEDTYLMPDHPLDLDMQVLLYGACLEFQVDYALALAVVEQETEYGNLMGDGGESYGYMQVQKKWHEDRMALLGVTDLMDPEGNFRVGCHFLRECIDKYGLERGLGFYNSGKAIVTDYSREVMGRLS